MRTRLAGLAEVAEIVKVTKRTASRYTRRGDFPKAVENLASGPVWLRSDVEAWAKSTLPLRSGRPRSDVGEGAASQASGTSSSAKEEPR